MDLEEGAASRAARLTERRRRRREAERRRRAQLRRRNLLACAALTAFAFGIVRGAGHEAGPVSAATSGGGSGSGSRGGQVETVDDFHEPVPILMYHAISPAPAGSAYPDLFVSQPEFEDQMEWLSDQGYNGVTLGDVFAAWNDGEPIAENPVVISFDDGLRSQYVGGRPVLDKLGWPAVLNLKVESVDQGELTEDMVEELIDAGWEIDSHTISHSDVSALEGDELEEQLAGSRDELEQRFGVPVDFFAYPAGAFDAESVAAVEDTGYLGAVTTEPGLASPDESPYELRRIRIEGGDGAEGLETKLADTG